jgi:hypothetical protein
MQSVLDPIIRVLLCMPSCISGAYFAAAASMRTWQMLLPHAMITRRPAAHVHTGHSNTSGLFQRAKKPRESVENAPAGNM